MTLHDELNKAGNNNINFSLTIMEQRNQQLMLNNFIQNFQKTNQSIISDLFYAMNCNMIQCSSCGTQSYNYQTYFFLVFPLEEVRKNKFSNFNQFNNFNNMFNNNEVNIYDCFEYDKKISFMTGQNAMHCNYCQKTCNSSMCTVLTTGPIILIIILNRGIGIEFNVKINFVEQLNLANYIQFGNTGVNYELIGVITHLGNSGMSGHFIAYCKNPISNTWYQYNDAMVNPVNNFKKDVIDFAMPYLLFYQKMN
jgi:ubiquitin C-terminal hydrolase